MRSVFITSFLKVLCTILICLLSGLSNRAAADENEDTKTDVYDLPTPVAIQGRTNKIDESISINIGYIPTDSFNRGFPLALNYAFYFRPFLAWEALSFGYNFNRETQLKQDFKNLGVQVQNLGFGGVIDFPQNIIMTGVVYTPLYGKSLLFNDSLVHSEASLYLGAGTLVFNKVGHIPAIAPGIQGRFFLSPRSALRYYFRQYFFNDSQLGLTGITDFGLGYEFQFNFLSRRRTSEGEE